MLGPSKNMNKKILTAVCRLVALMLVVLCFAAAAQAETIVVPVGGDVPAAINSATCGDTIVLQAGAAYITNLTLPNKPCTGEITIQSSLAAELLPNVRVTPAQSPLLAKLQSNVNALPVISTAAGAHGYKFIGVEISTVSAGVVVYDLVRWGESRQAQTALAQVPRGLSLDRSYVHGWDTQDVQRGVAMNCTDCEVTNSTVSDIHMVGTDTQAICAWNTPGSLRIINNQLDAAGENLLIGGADPASADMMPSDIQIRRNDMLKPLSWKIGDATYAGKHWTVKNLLELKNARNVTIDGNTFTNCWTDGQTGIPILFTVRNQEGTAPYSIISNVTFTNNVVKNAQGVFNLLGTDNEKPSQRASALLIANNVSDKITGPFLTMNGYHDVTIVNNTDLQTCVEGCNTTTLYGQVSERFTLRDNVFSERAYGMFGEGGLIGKPAFDKWTPGATVTGNVVGTPYLAKIEGNLYPAILEVASDYRTPYAAGANIDALLAVQSETAAPAPSPTVQPSPSPTPTSTPTPQPTPTATPLPSPVPSPTIQPTPTPTPTPASCVMTVAAPTLAQWSSGTLTVTLTGPLPPSFTVTATPDSGQLTVTPRFQPISSATSVTTAFRVQSKKKSANVIINGPCGPQTVMVNVQ